MKMGKRPDIQLQDRDYELLRGLLESRVMTLSHAATLYFDGKSEMAKKRIQKLKAASIVRERPRQFSAPSVLFLGRKALTLLRDNGHLADYPGLGIGALDKRAQVSDQKLKHELEVMDVKAAMVATIKGTERYGIAEFSTWPALYQFRACKSNGELVPVQPDGFIRIHEKEADGGLSEHALFLEVDRSYEALKIVSEKAHCYLDYYRSGRFAVRNGGTHEQYKEFPFRVLFVCKTEARRDNIAERLLQNDPPISSLVWLTTATEIFAAPLGAIWCCPAGYRDAASEASLEQSLRPKRMLLEP